MNVVPISQSDVSSLKACILGKFGDPDPLESDYRPGAAYKRISRPMNIGASLNTAIDTTAATQSFIPLNILLTKMEDIFEAVEPAPTILQTYGHKTRELLLFAYMEVEASLTAVLRANDYFKDRSTTKAVSTSDLLGAVRSVQRLKFRGPLSTDGR